MADPEAPQPLPQAGEPGTFAVTAAEPARAPHVTDHPDQSGAPPKLRVQDLSIALVGTLCAASAKATGLKSACAASKAAAVASFSAPSTEQVT